MQSAIRESLRHWPSDSSCSTIRSEREPRSPEMWTSIPRPHRPRGAAEPRASSPDSPDYTLPPSPGSSTDSNAEGGLPASAIRRIAARISSSVFDESFDYNLRLYAGMNRSMNQIYAGYNESELKAIADFLQRTAESRKTQQTS